MLLKFCYFILFLNESSVDVYMHSAPFRWKQYDAYVQVLEAKYADLCCKSNTNILLFTRGISYTLGNFGWPLTYFPTFPPPPFLANDVTGLKESEEKLKQQQQESARRENILVMRLATKEQEMQDCTVCIHRAVLLPAAAVDLA